MKLTLRRNRYQRGSLTIEKRAAGPDVWVYRWRECPGDCSIQRKRIVGTKKELPTEASAWKAVDGLRLDINSDAVSGTGLTVDQLIAHYKEVELCEGSSKSARTQEVYIYHLDKVIAPRWGRDRLSDVKPVAVEKWLETLPGAPGTHAKTKSVMNVLFQHAMRF